MNLFKFILPTSPSQISLALLPVS